MHTPSSRGAENCDSADDDCLKNAIVFFIIRKSIPFGDQHHKRISNHCSIRYIEIEKTLQKTHRTLQGYALYLRDIILQAQPQGMIRLVGWDIPIELIHELTRITVGENRSVIFAANVTSENFEDNPKFDNLSTLAKNYDVNPPSIPIETFIIKNENSNLVLEDVEKIIESLYESRNIKYPGATHLYDPLICIQSKPNARSAIVCIPGAGDNVASFFEFSNCLPNNAIYGMQPRGLNTDFMPHTSVQAASASYLQALQSLPPRQPIHLIGHSFGGWIAFDLAIKMQCLGTPVESLTILDSDYPDRPSDHQPDYTFDEVLLELSTLLELSSKIPLHIDARALMQRDYLGKIELLHQRMTEVGLLPKRSSAKSIEGMVRTFDAALRCTYQPAESYSGTLRLICVPHSRNSTPLAFHLHCEQLKNGWRKWASDISLWAGPGNHITILRSPQVESLTDWLNNEIPSLAIR